MIIVENNYYVFLLHANTIPSLAKVENEKMPNFDWSTVDSSPVVSSLLQTPCHCRQKPAPGETHTEMAEINSLYNRLLLLQ